MKKINYLFQIKKLSKLWIISAGLLVSAGVFSQDITTGLVLQYDFDAISGTTVPDISGNNNAGTLMGAAKDTIGYSNNGVKCTLKADYIALPAGFTSNLTSFTYAAWVKLSALKNATRFFDLGTGADATNNALVFIPSYNGDNQVMCLRYRPATGTSVNVLSTTKCPTGTWAHVAVTYDWNGTTGTAKIYLNGAVVGTGTGLTYNPSLSLGTTTNNILGVSRWTQDTNGFNGIFDDVRFYNRALTATDVSTLNGLAELNNQFTALTLGDLSAVTSNLTLPKTAGTKGVTIRWASSKPAVIDTLGTVTRPSQYNTNVTLTATLSQNVSGVVYTLSKPFTATVIGIIPTPDQLATWNFKTENITLENDTLRVTDILSGFKGKLVNEARIRTIGQTEHINVLDLGSGKGYFDMGTDIGKAIYSLSNHTITGYFRVDDAYTNLAAGGNYYWNFSNSANVGTIANGFMYGRLSAQAAGISAAGSPSTSASAGAAAAKGGWHHIAYSLNGTIGTVYIDGTQVAQNTAMLLPSVALAKDNMSGTICNWLGRSGWASDAYLQQTLLYDFRVFSIPLSADDMNFGFDGFDGIGTTLDKLNAAYIENSDYIAPELSTEKDQLSLGDLSAVTNDIVLPSKGNLDQTITISWKTTNPSLISATGKVIRPDYYSMNDTLTATLLKNGQSTKKVFPATVLLKDNSQFSNDLLVKYDFSSVSDSIVTDAAEKHFKGVLKNKAKVHTIGKTIKYNVLSLGDSIGYFDLGPEIGKLMYNLTDYTMSAYYRVDTAYHSLTSNGNFLWNLSNGQAAMTDQNGYIIGSLRDQSVSTSPGYYTAASGNQAVSFASAALVGGWHNLTYTQSGTTGTIYVDGMPMATSTTITNLPKNVLPKAGRLGTLYNWIGRSCYAGDVYLRKTLVYDFRLYRTALSDEQIQSSVLNVGTTINALEIAYTEDPTAVKSITSSPYKVVSTDGGIKISGLLGTEKISLFDISGRQLKVTNPTLIKTNSGVYLVKINDSIAKVLVK